ncbi:hypothetical protein GIB67_034987, partial [Kingdonia uniflora]
MHFENSNFRCETDEYFPVKFSPAARDGSLSCAFPAGWLGQYGSSDATNILLGALSQVKYVKSRTSLASLEVIAKNSSRAHMQIDLITCASSGMFVNLCDVMLRHTISECFDVKDESMERYKAQLRRISLPHKLWVPSYGEQ